MTYTVGSLFAGIGGFDLGFERAGFKTAWQVETDPYCQKVLAKNFPEAERFGDIRECGSHNLKPVDVICGGFPCQDISFAGKRGGIEAERSGLWSEYARILRDLRPRFALIENVAALIGFGLERVLCDLASLGFDAEWEIISAEDVGAPHLRERVWILAYAQGFNEREQTEAAYAIANGWQAWDESCIGREYAMANTASQRRQQARELRSYEPTERVAGCGAVTYSDSFDGREGWARGSISCSEDREGERTKALAYADILAMVRTAISRRECDPWHPEPQVGRVVDGVSVQLVANELRSLGNAVVPQIPEMIARRIKKALEAA